MRSSSLEKLMEKVNVLSNDECWEWKTEHGNYGIYNDITGKRTTAHRALWSYLFGEVPENLDVAHKCGNKKCLNPSHLYLSSDTENTREASWRDRYLYPKTTNEDNLMLIMNKVKAIKYKGLMRTMSYENISNENVIKAYGILNYSKPKNMEIDSSRIMTCGHDKSYIVSNGEGTSYCLMCEYMAQNAFIERILFAIDKYRNEV